MCPICATRGDLLWWRLGFVSLPGILQVNIPGSWPLENLILLTCMISWLLVSLASSFYVNLIGSWWAVSSNMFYNDYCRLIIILRKHNCSPKFWSCPVAPLVTDGSCPSTFFICCCATLYLCEGFVSCRSCVRWKVFGCSSLDLTVQEVTSSPVLLCLSSWKLSSPFLLALSDLCGSSIEMGTAG